MSFVVADEAEAVRPDSHGGVLSTLPVLSSVLRVALVQAVSEQWAHLEVAVSGIVVADEAEAVRSDRHRGVLADVARAVQGGGVTLVLVQARPSSGPP